LAFVSANVLVVHPSVQASSVKELIAFLKENPGKYSFAHPGRGTTAQLSGEMFRLSQKLDIGPVSFNGSAPAIQSALGGHTPIAFTVITPAVPQVKEGRLRGDLDVLVANNGQPDQLLINDGTGGFTSTDLPGGRNQAAASRSVISMVTV
jgi:hypothetical protein